MSATLEIKDVTKRYGTHVALAEIDLEVEAGSFVSLLGPSGCGKTTLLRIIAGILSPDQGEVRLEGRRVTHDPPFARDLAMVFQDYALFPHMTVFENVAFGIRMRGTADEKRKLADRVGETLDLVRLGHLAGRFPAELSGGQQQRIAIARALAPKPALLLMDEPLSNLDAKVREEMRGELKDIQKRTAVTTVYVTHDQEEALALSDRVVVMSNGRIAQIGTPEQIYEAPRNRFVAGFVGKANILEGRWVGDRFLIADGLTLVVAEPGDCTAPAVAIRPEHLDLDCAPDAHANTFEGLIVDAVYTGSVSYLTISLQEATLLALSINRLGVAPLSPGRKILVGVPPEAVRPLVR